MMQFLKRYRRQALLTAAVLLTCMSLVVLTAPASRPAAPTTTVGEALNVRRAAPATSNVSEITDAQIAAYQEKLRAKPDDSLSNARLGLAYLQKARELGDPTYYGRAEGVFNRALQSDPNNIEAMGGLGSLALARHQFEKGLEWGLKAMALRPQMPYNYGVVSDALVELGRYPQAVEMVQQMVDLRPDLSSYSRVSYIRELHGQYDGAIEAMQQAVTAGGPTLENRAWVTYQLGNLYFNRHDLENAEKNYRQALKLVPDYVYAQAGLGKLMAARGDIDRAIKLYEGVTRRMPLAEFVIEYGDILSAAGRSGEAARQYELVRAIAKLYNDNGVDTDLEMALFDADHSYKLPEALAKIKKLYEQRPSIKVADTLAWTLYQSGDYQAAAHASRQALRLGTLDSLSFFHAGMIASKLGQTGEARAYLEKALTINPNFSFRHAPLARQTLAGLGGAPASR